MAHHQQHQREGATRVSCIQVIDHESRPRSIHFFVSMSSFFLLFSSVTVQPFSCVFPLRAPMSSDSNLGLETVECLSIPRPVHFTPVHPGTIIGSPGCYPGNSLAHTRLQAVCNKQCVATSVQTVCSIVNIVHNVCALFLQYTALCVRDTY